MHFIFDLDDTVINSSHRQRFINGELDLPYWKENNTPEKVLLDTLLPLANVWRKAESVGHEIVICTSRVFTNADYKLLKSFNLEYDDLISRPENDETSCGYLKLRQLAEWQGDLFFSWDDFTNNSIMFDDSLDVQKVLRANGVRVICPNYYNSRKKLAA